MPTLGACIRAFDEEALSIEGMLTNGLPDGEHHADPLGQLIFGTDPEVAAIPTVSPRRRAGRRHTVRHLLQTYKITSCHTWCIQAAANSW